MKKLLATAIVAATPMMAQADLLFTVEAGASIWQADATGSVESSIGDVVDLGSDGMNLKESDQNVLFASFEHPIPVLPNVKVMSTALEFDGDTQSTLDLSHSDLTLYWGVPLPIPFLDINFGLTARQFDGQVTNVSASTPIDEKLDFVIPMGYLNLDLDTPFGIYGYVDLNTISYSGNGVTDTAIAIGYTLPIPLVDINLEAGHRSLSVDTDEDLAGIDTDIDVAGMFYGVNLSVGF
jgi:outer membrane protein